MCFSEELGACSRPTRKRIGNIGLEEAKDQLQDQSGPSPAGLAQGECFSYCAFAASLRCSSGAAAAITAKAMVANYQRGACAACDAHLAGWHHRHVAVRVALSG